MNLDKMPDSYAQGVAYTGVGFKPRFIIVLDKVSDPTNIRQTAKKSIFNGNGKRTDKI